VRGVLAITESSFVEPRRRLLVAGKIWWRWKLRRSGESFGNGLLLWIGFDIPWRIPRRQGKLTNTLSELSQSNSKHEPPGNARQLRAANVDACKKSPASL